MRVYLCKDFDVRCSHCRRVVSYSQRYDSYFCMPCNLWLEEQCSEPRCEFCAGRAEEPDGVTDLDAAKPAEAERLPPLISQTPSIQLSKVQAASHPEPSSARPAPRSDAHFWSRLSRVL
jgi:hypothetical protein